MQLNDEQKKLVAQWAADGCGLADIQKRINDELKLSLTFMDVRFLILDMGIEIKDRQSLEISGSLDLSKHAPAQTTETSESQGVSNEFAEGHAPGAVSVEIDRVKKPNAIVSGTVKFSDGVSASWSVDQLGQLAINPVQAGYQPSQNDLQKFQKELSRLLQSHGF